MLTNEEQAMTLLDLGYNKNAKVKEVLVQEATKRRLMDIGLTKGANIFVRGKAPLGDPLLISVRGFDLAIRKADAKNIIIEG